ncbi:DUF3159 domain-containing protein [Psychromicrobium xiongbiense]|uniref:DUF3159 domain-containing protein n=1 Tax=Psychromicrobium xiongbiense TaxID=3051184 RepID=UPI002553EB1F|nr:DUF3159 domain-containing protein [Psychromicrobium sp. YIM S02556]
MSDSPEDRPGFAQIAQSMAQSRGLERRDDGHLDLRQAVGGWRGLAETILPGLVFLVVFVSTQDLTPSLIGAVAVGAVFTVWRLLQRGPILQAFSGLVGIVICAIFARTTGNALDYYVPGFWTNVVSIVVVVLTIVLRWPITGLVFGFIRGENVQWREQPLRLRAYTLAAWVVAALFVLRLVVQLPLYFAQNLAALGATRLAMGVPLYALALWLAWMVSRPAARSAAEQATGDQSTENQA